MIFSSLLLLLLEDLMRWASFQKWATFSKIIGNLWKELLANPTLIHYNRIGRGAKLRHWLKILQKADFLYSLVISERERRCYRPEICNWRSSNILGGGGDWKCFSWRSWPERFSNFNPIISPIPPRSWILPSQRNLLLNLAWKGLSVHKVSSC